MKELVIATLVAAAGFGLIMWLMMSVADARREVNEQTCTGILALAKTAQDTLAVVTERAYCLKFVRTP